MEKHVRLEEASLARRFIAPRLRALAPLLPSRIVSPLRLGRRLLALSQPRIWRFALLPIVVTISLLLAAGRPIAWGVIAAEALAAICALAGWGALRSYRPTSPGEFPYLGVGLGLLAFALLATLPLLTSATAPVLVFGALSLGLIALDLAPTFLPGWPPRAIFPVARCILASLLLGVGLVTVTALTQRARPGTTLWLIGGVLSLLAFAMTQAHDMVVDDAIHDQKAPWRRPFIPLVGALALAGALVIAAALPVGAPHGFLLALGTLPLALVAVTGLWRSIFIPARALSARRLEMVFTLVALLLSAGALVSALVSAGVAALIQVLGG